MNWTNIAFLAAFLTGCAGSAVNSAPSCGKAFAQCAGVEGALVNGDTCQAEPSTGYEQVSCPGIAKCPLFQRCLLSVTADETTCSDDGECECHNEVAPGKWESNFCATGVQ